ncbi:MAG: hypothetical protein Q9201_000674 [Fulgogasparrea decipioides]
MVNVAGRSKGCNTCRRRRVKCDERHPNCRRCEKAGFECEGFQHPLRIVLDQSCANVLRRHEKPGVRPNRAPSAAAHQNSLTSQESGSIAARRHVIHKAYALPVEVGLSPFQDSIQSTFLVVNFLSQVEFGRKSVLEVWNEMSPTEYPSKRALEAAFFGRFHRRQDICEAGYRWYGKALCKLSKDLSDPQMMLSTAVLRSTILLVMYEMVAATLSDAWVHHSDGISRLLEARGPRRHQALEERLILEAVRPIVIAKAVADGKRTFLERPEWLTLPWASVSGQKSSFEELLDLSCAIPGLVEDRRELSLHKASLATTTADAYDQGRQAELTRDYHPVALTLAARCRHLLDRSRAWKRAWDMEGEPVTLLPSYPITPTYPHYPYHVFDQPLSFSDMHQANTYVMYHTLVVGFLTLAYEINYEASSLSTDTHNDAIGSSFFLQPGAVATPPYTDHSDHYMLVERYKSAVEICRAVPYHLSNEASSYGGAYVIKLPLLMTRQVFCEDSEELKFIDTVLKCLAETWGFDLRKTST